MARSTGRMKAILYTEPGKFEVREVPIPKFGDDEVLLKVTLCGFCGSDQHIHDGVFVSPFPLTPGHEVVGVVADLGGKVTGLAKGDRVVGDPMITCGTCFYCKRGSATFFCEALRGHGLSIPGGFGEYVVYAPGKLHKIHKLTDEEATLVEPTTCGLQVIYELRRTPVGAHALVLGAGPSGVVIAQMLKLNGAVRVVMAANQGRKMEAARQVGSADEYVALQRDDPSVQWEDLARENPHGFDIVIEATGSIAVANRAIDYVRKGGTLVLYAVYSEDALVQWPPFKILMNKINIVGSVGQENRFPHAVEYLESGKINVKGLVTDVFSIDEYQEALDKFARKDVGKMAIRPVGVGSLH